METPEDHELLFAFAHGIRMAFESLGKPFDSKTAHPLLRRMDRILGSPKYSLVRADDSVDDWDRFRRFREIEVNLCADYLREVAIASGVPNDGQSP